MNKRQIVAKLKSDLGACNALIQASFASDSQIKLEAMRDYILNVLEYIEQEGKV